MKRKQSLKDRRQGGGLSWAGRLGTLAVLVAMTLMPYAPRAIAQDSPAAEDKASTPTATPTATPTPSPSPTPSPTPTPTPVPTATPTPTPKPSPIPVTTPTPIPVVKLNPVLKAEPKTVTLSPIIRRDEAKSAEATQAPKTTLVPITKPEPTPTPEAKATPEAAPEVTPVPTATPTPAPTPTPTPAPTPEVTPAPKPQEEAPAQPEVTSEPTKIEPAPAANIEKPEPIQVEPVQPEPAQTSAPEPTSPAAAPQTLDADFRQALAEPSGAAARNDLRQLVVAHPEAPLTGDALVRIAEISMELNEPGEALMALKAAAQSGKPRPDLLEKAQDALVISMMNTGNLVGASRQYVAFARQDPALKDTPDTQAAQAFLAAIDGDYASAAGQWQSLADRLKAQPVTTSGTDSPIHKPIIANESAAVISQALCEELAGHPAQAHQTYQRILDQFPDSPEASIARDRLADLDRSILK